MKPANLPRHLRRVHPRADATPFLAAAPEGPPRKPTALDRRLRRRRLLAPLLLVTVLVVPLAAYGLGLLGGGEPPPAIRVSPTSLDLGEIPPQVVEATFTVTNAGEGDLVLRYLYTSCSCTSAVLRFQGQESPRFGMHDNPEGWSVRLRPGERGDLVVRYDPNVHPDTGPIVRAAYVQSNDPRTPEVQVTMTAIVVRG